MARVKNPLTAGDTLVQDIRGMIEGARAATASAVNAILTTLYWQIGKRIHGEILKGDQFCRHCQQNWPSLWRRFQRT
jgi:hypothetical protein